MKIRAPFVVTYDGPFAFRVWGFGLLGYRFWGYNLRGSAVKL